MTEPAAPLEDPTYQPTHPPLPDGSIPPVVEKWGPRSQLRWFERFANQVAPMRPSEWGRFYCSTTVHRGGCCISCQDDARMGFSYIDGCCCKAPSEDDE